MDAQLKERLKLWHDQIEIVRKAELQCFSLEAHEKSKYSSLFLSAEGKSIAEREAIAYASPEWSQFSSGLAEAKSVMLNERRLLELKQKAYEAEYLGAKMEADAIRRSPA